MTAVFQVCGNLPTLMERFFRCVIGLIRVEMCVLLTAISNPNKSFAFE